MDDELTESVTESGLHILHKQGRDLGSLRAGSRTRGDQAEEALENGDVERDVPHTHDREQNAAQMDMEVCAQCGDHVFIVRNPYRRGWGWQYKGNRVCSVRCLARAATGKEGG